MSWYYSGPSLDPEGLERLLAAHSDSLGICMAASLHRNGFVREAAVRHLAEQWTGEEFRWLLLRCTDPVQQVRAPAGRAVRARALDPELSIRYSASVVDAVALITGERLNRPWAASLRTELLDVLVRPEQRAELRSAAWSRDRPTRRAAVGLLVRQDDLLGLLRTQLRRDDVVAVATVAQAALANPAICGEAAETLFGSRNARLRAEGLWHLVDHAHRSKEAINNGLADPAPNVRSVAQYLAARKGAVPRDRYLSQVPRDPVGALLGLGDVGSATDVELATPFLDSDDSRQRAAAVRLVARMGSREHLPVLLAAIGERGRIARDAIAGIIRLGVDDEVARAAASQAQSGTSLERRRIYGRLLPAASRWVALRRGLEAAASDDAELRALGADLLRRTRARWNQSFVWPRDEEFSDLRLLLERAKPNLTAQDPDIVQEFKSILGSGA